MRKKSVSVKQIQKLDKVAIRQYGVPSLSLMENAGKSVALEVLKQIKGKKGAKVCVICGLGNNAGDGFVVARHLINARIKTNIYLIGSGRRLKEDAAVNYKILKKIKYPIKEVKNVQDRLAENIKQYDVIVDAIFGVGLNRDIGEPFYSIIELINKYGRKIVSVDIPSGLDGTSGKTYGICVKADITVTFTYLKSGFLKGHGPSHVGRAAVVDIGIPISVCRLLKL